MTQCFCDGKLNEYLDTIVSEMIPIVLHPLIKFPHLPGIKRDRQPSLLPHPRRCTHTHSYPGGIIQSRSHPLKKSTQKERGKGRPTHSLTHGWGRSDGGDGGGHLELRGCSRLLGEFRPFHPEGLSRVGGEKKSGSNQFREFWSRFASNHLVKRQNGVVCQL